MQATITETKTTITTSPPTTSPTINAMSAHTDNHTIPSTR